MADSVKTKIATAMLARLDLVAELNYRAFDIVRLKSSDFSDWEMPAVQCIDLAEVIEHEQRRKKAFWNIAIEVIMGPSEQETVSQAKLWDLMQVIETTLWAVPGLGLSEVVHMRHLSTSTDLHLMKPLYLGRLELAVIYYQPLVGEC
jgi:hypothetical protein